jgi:hypothetical protein
MYGKHFASMYTGSMYGSGAVNFAVWGWIVANVVKGMIEVNPKLLAPIIGCSVGEVQTALTTFQQPDPESRNQEEEGRKLIKVGQFAYHVVSHGKYNAIRHEEDRREYLRDYKAAQRENEDFRKKEDAVRQQRRQHPSTSVNNVNRRQPASSHTDTHTDTSSVVVVECASAVPYVSPTKAIDGAAPQHLSAAQAEAEKLKSFEQSDAEPGDAYAPSARILQIAGAFAQHLGVVQDLDFSPSVSRRAEVVDNAPEAEVVATVEYVLFRDDSGYWKNQMLNEDGGAGGLKVLVRGYRKIADIAKSKGTRKAQPAAKRAKTEPFKANSCNPNINTTKFAEEGDSI